MKRILITGMSGTGKSSVIEKLVTQGYKAVDLDSDEYSEWVDVDPQTDPLTPAPGKDWRWRTGRVQALLSQEDINVLIVSGCAENMGLFMSQFDVVVLLSAPSNVIMERLAIRTNNDYGKQPHEAAQVLALKESIEPLLRAASNYEIDTSIGIEEVLANLLEIIKK